MHPFWASRLLRFHLQLTIPSSRGRFLASNAIKLHKWVALCLTPLGPPSYRLQHDFGDIFNLNLCFFLHRQDAVLKVEDTIGTGCRQNLGAHFNGMLHRNVRETLPLLVLHPDPASPATATEAVSPGFHLVHEGQAGNAVQDLSRFFVDAAVTSQIAGIMIHDFLLIPVIECESTLIKEVSQVLDYMRDLELASQWGYSFLKVT